MAIDWSGTLEAYHPDGRTFPVTLTNQWAGACDYITKECPDELTSNEYWHESGSNGVQTSPWRIRNVATAIPAPIAERMAHAIKRHCEGFHNVREGFSVEAEFRAIIAELTPIGPDIAEAEAIMAMDEYKGGNNNIKRAITAAIKRGRELEKQSSNA